MGMVLGMAGMLGFIGFAIYFIVLLIKKRPKKMAGIGLAVCLVCFIIGIAITGDPSVPDDGTNSVTDAHTQGTIDEPESEKSQQEINEELRATAIEADFVKINGDEWKDKEVFAQGTVSNVSIAEPMITFTLTAKEGDAFGVYSIVTSTTLVDKVTDGETIKAYGFVDGRDDSEMPKISVTIIDKLEQPVEVPKETMGQKNAVAKAKSYLGYMPFSHEGLIKQLEFEKFSNEDAVYGADNCDADWNEQAVKKAKSYLDISAFSRDGLIDQLAFDGFSTEQAEYGATQNGY